MATTRTTRARTTASSKPPDKRKINGLNLDKLEREGEPTEPYTTVLGGRPFTFKDPMEEDWQDQAKVDTNNAVSMLKSLLSDEDWEHFRKFRMKSWKLLALVKDIQRYYADDEDEDEGNGSASPDL